MYVECCKRKRYVYAVVTAAGVRPGNEVRAVGVGTHCPRLDGPLSGVHHPRCILPRLPIIPKDSPEPQPSINATRRALIDRVLRDAIVAYEDAQRRNDAYVEATDDDGDLDKLNGLASSAWRVYTRRGGPQPPGRRPAARSARMS